MGRGEAASTTVVAAATELRSGACPGSQDGEVQIDLLLAVIVRFSQDGSGGSGQLFQLMGTISGSEANLEKFSTGEGVRRSIGQRLQCTQHQKPRVVTQRHCDLFGDVFHIEIETLSLKSAQGGCGCFGNAIHRIQRQRNGTRLFVPPPIASQSARHRDSSSAASPDR